MYIPKEKGDMHMELKCLAKDRKELVKALERRLECKAKYLGAPTFAYEIGPYKVEKDGTLTADDQDVDQDLIAELSSKGFLESPEAEGSTCISIPISEHDGKSLMNIVFRTNSKDELLSKVAGRPGAFKVSKALVAALDTERPQKREEFIKILEGLGGNEINHGIEFTDQKIIFSGFRYTTEPAMIDAYTKLVEKISIEAITKKRIRPDRIGLTDNEKYSFRNWLVTIGMSGDEYKAARAVLLRNLSGHIAFRTKKQAEAATEKWAAIRKERREQECSVFHVL